MSTRLYVGNLDEKVTAEQIKELFSQAGKVIKTIVVTDKYTGKSRGFGFVEMNNSKEAEKAIKMLNGEELQGKKIKVSEAHSR